jgi:hypothetical protein
MPTCKLPNCPVAKDGRCLEGRGATCPNLIPDPLSPTQPAHPGATTPARNVPEKTFHPLPGVTPLEIAQARYFSGRSRAIVVALVGMKECGKTTLLARLHQLFLSRPLAGFDFAGGRSLPRFEELNWLATVESGVAQPKMPRTSSQFDNSFIHVAVRPSSGGARVDLLLNDISGETFNAAIAAQSTCETLLALARADHLVTLIDGAALADPARRHLHASQVADFLQRVIQSGQCGTQTALHLVVSKKDELKGNLAPAEAVETDITARFANHFGGITPWRIAARPMDGSLPTVEPIGKLFAAWVQTTHRYPTTFPATPPRHTWHRDFCRFGT